MTDPRKVLGVGPHAPLHHPDAGGHAERFKEITTAYLRLCAAPSYPVLSDYREHRVKIIYGQSSTYRPSFLWMRRILSPTLVWQRGRLRVAMPFLIVIAAPVAVWVVSPYAAILISAVILLGGRTAHRKF